VEGVGLVFTVTLDNAVQGAFDVDAMLADMTATGGASPLATPEDYDNDSQTLNFTGAAGETKQFTVSTLDDAVLETVEEFTVSLDASNALVADSDTATGTVTDNDDAQVTVEDVTAVEGVGLMFTVTLDNAVQGAFGVDVTLADVTATGGASPLATPEDYDNASQTLDFTGTAGEARQFTVNTLDDAVVEVSETFIVSLGASNALMSDNDTATGTVTDNDTATFTISDATVDEAAGTLTLTVSLDNPVDVETVVELTYGGGTATGGGTDYDSSADQVTFAAGDTADKTVTVAITDDNVVELSETFTASLSTNTALGTRTTNLTDTGTGTITNDDNATLFIDDVSLQEGEAGITPFTFTVRLDGEVDAGVQVAFATADGTAEDENGDDDYQSTSGTLTFSGHSGEEQTITVSVNADIVVEPVEDFFVNLTGIAAGGRSVAFADNQGRGDILPDEAQENQDNLVTQTTGEISAPAEVDDYLLDVTQGTVYSLQVWDHLGAGLDPDVVEIIDAQGKPVPLWGAVADAAAGGPSRSAVVVQLAPGQYRVRVRSQNATFGSYRLDLRLPGALNGERIVRARSVQLAEAAMLQREFGFNAIAQDLFGHKLGVDLSVDQFRFEFDANLNGYIDPMDLNVIVTNFANGSAVESMATFTRIVVAAPPASPPVIGTAAGELALSDLNLAVYQNPNHATDVDASGLVTPLDALLVINKVNADGSGSLDVTLGETNQSATGEGEADARISAPFYDVNGDYVISPLDVLLVVNELNGADSTDGTAKAEGEAVGFAWAKVPPRRFSDGRPSVAEVSRSGDHDTTGFFRAGSGALLGAGLLTPPKPPGTGLQEPTQREIFGTNDVSGQQTFARPTDAKSGRPSVRLGARSRDLRTAAGGVRTAESGDVRTAALTELLESDSELIDLLAEDVETVWI